MGNDGEQTTKVPGSVSTAIAQTSMQRTQLVDELAAARLLQLRPRTLAAWRARRWGPPFVRISKKCVRYSVADLSAWLRARTQSAESGEARAWPVHLRLEVQSSGILLLRCAHCGRFRFMAGDEFPVAEVVGVCERFRLAHGGCTP